MLCLLALALPLQGALAASAMPRVHPPAPHTMVMPDGTVMADMPGQASDSAPCPHHAVYKVGCGACCGPAAAQQAQLAVAPAAVRWAPAAHPALHAANPLFLTGSLDRPPAGA